MLITLPDTVIEPDTKTDPVNTWLLEAKLPNMFDPEEYCWDAVTVWTTILVTVSVPWIVWSAVNMFEPVVAKLPVLAFIDAV